MRKCNGRHRASILISAAMVTIGYAHHAHADTFYLYDANSQTPAPDPTTPEGGTWSNSLGGTQTSITAGAGTDADGNYWQITDPVTNGSKGYIVTPPVADYQDPTGWTATIVCKVLVSSGPKATTGLYSAPSFLDIRTGAGTTSAIGTMGQVNAGADESFFRASGGSTNNITLQDMDVHSYFNTYQMVYQPEQLDGDGNLTALATLTEYVNGHKMSDTTAVSATGVNRIQWFSGAQTSLQTIQYQLIKFESGVDVMSAPAAEVWQPNGGGEFALGTNWVSGNVPSGTNSTAHLGQTDAPSTITVSTPQNLGMLELNNTSGYTFTGAGTLTMVNSIRGAGAVDVDAGHQTISSPISFERAGIFTVLDASASLSLTGIVDSVRKDFRKAGPGAMDTPRLLTNALKVSGGTLTIRANGTAAGVCKVSSLDISFNTSSGATAFTPIATMQLNDNPLIIDYTGTAPTTTLRNSLKGAFDNGAWDGPGLTSATVTANAADSNNPHKTALAYGDASVIGVTTVGDQTLDQTSLLVHITLSGDANMDGTVNALDFNAVASNFGTTGMVWTQGDFNYDGTVDTNDFTMLSLNYNQSMALSPATTLSTLVPEPATFAMLTLLGAAMVMNRRRRCD